MKLKLKILLVAIGIILLGAAIVEIALRPSWPQAQAARENQEEVTELARQKAAEEEYNLCLAIVDEANEKLAAHYDKSIGYEFQEGETLEKFTTDSKRDCSSLGEQLVNSEDEEAIGFLSPEELSYVFKKSDDTYVSQDMGAHGDRNNYYAVDVATGGKYLEVFAPSWDWTDEDGYHDEPREYTVKKVINEGTTGLSIELYWQEKGSEMNWMIGHMKEIWVDDGDTVKTGQVLGSSGACPGDLQYGEKSTGCHVHIEVYSNGLPVVYPASGVNKHTSISESEESDTQESSQSYDIDKLALAIAHAETQNCTTGMALTKNNCHGIMTWERGFREGKTFASHEESFEAFKKLWKENYDTPLGFESVFKWVNGPKAERTEARMRSTNTYLENALYWYNK